MNTNIEFANQGYYSRPLTINEITIYPVKGYQQQWLRPLTMDLDYDKLNRIENILNTKSVSLATGQVVRSSGIVTGTDIAQEVPDLLKPSAAPVARVEIPYGWQEKRGVFTLIAESKVDEYASLIYYVQGYTEYLDMSRSGFLPDDMKFYMNSIMEIRKIWSPSLGRYEYSILGHYSVNHVHGVVHVTNNDTGITTTYNPYDVMAKLESELLDAKPSTILQDLSARRMLESDDVTIVPNTILSSNNGETADLVDRKHTTSTGHLSSTLTAVLSSSLVTDFGYDDADILGNAVATAENRVSTDLLFIQKLILAMQGLQTSYFTLNTLRQIDPSLSKERIVVMQPGQLENIGPSVITGQESEELAAPTKENVIATYIAEFMVHGLTEAGLLGITVEFDNKTGANQAFILHGVPAIPDLPVPKLLERVRLKIINELLPVITESGMLLVEAVVSTDIRRESKINISINNNPPIPFRIPIFADSTFNPIITNVNGLKQLTKGYEEVVNLVLQQNN